MNKLEQYQEPVLMSVGVAAAIVAMLLFARLVAEVMLLGLHLMID